MYYYRPHKWYLWQIDFGGKQTLACRTSPHRAPIILRIFNFPRVVSNRCTHALRITGAGAPVFDLTRDPREQIPLIETALLSGASFQDMVKRHMMGIHKYPHAKGGRGKPYEGISNLRPESKETVRAFESWH